jgi:hypothetical protein
LRAPPSLNVSRLVGGHAPGPFVHEQWDSEVAINDKHSAHRHWAPNVSHNDDDGDDNDDDDDDGDDDDDEDSDEQSNFTLIEASFLAICACV